MAVANSETPNLATMSPRPKSFSLPVIALGFSLSVFFLISYLLCVLGFYLERSLGLSLPIAHAALAILLPGFAFDNWSRFLLGAVESLAWGWYVALIFGPLFNFFCIKNRGDQT